MKHTKLHGLIPVNISSAFELYLGVKISNDENEELIYNGDRLQFNKDESEFLVVPGTDLHSNLQLWRFERHIGYPKGVHSIIAVNANMRLFCEERFDEEGELYMDVNFTEIAGEA